MAGKVKQVMWVSGGLLGAFVLFHKAHQWWVRRKLDQLREAAARGEISTREFLDAALQAGQPNPAPGAVKVTVEEAKRMSCAAVFPESLSSLPEFAAAIEELRRNGTCL